MSSPARRRRGRRQLAALDYAPAVGAQPLRRWRPDMRCGICGTTIHLWQPFNYDHIKPMALGGRRGRANKTAAHLLCNRVKGSRYPFFLRTRAERAAIATAVSPDLYAALQRIWAGK